MRCPTCGKPEVQEILVPMKEFIKIAIEATNRLDKARGEIVRETLKVLLNAIENYPITDEDF